MPLHCLYPCCNFQTLGQYQQHTSHAVGCIPPILHPGQLSKDVFIRQPWPLLHSALAIAELYLTGQMQHLLMRPLQWLIGNVCVFLLTPPSLVFENSQ